MADELDRLFELLVHGLARGARVAIPFPAADVYERLVPYRSNRSRLNVATHQDYEMTVLRLLAGERGYLTLEPGNVREALEREVAETNPDPAFFRSFPDAQVMVNGRAADRVLSGDRAFAPPAMRTSDPEPDELADATGENPVPPDVPFAVLRAPAARSAEPDAAGTHCEYCGGVLPGNRDVRFCPHCGQPPAGELKCPACGNELDVGWAYCLSCGRATGFE
ncbi:MAG: zinc ribbon domain-containing protein [Gemmatimonadales bacterium]|nr:zinc ribbon domain-containing protein [Gemmatimonadales bacterium]